MLSGRIDVIRFAETTSQIVNYPLILYTINVLIYIKHMFAIFRLFSNLINIITTIVPYHNVDKIFLTFYVLW